jgi:hypothetical protein
MMFLIGPTSWWACPASELTDEHTAKLREYRCAAASCSATASSAATSEGFAEGLRRVFPDREIIDLPDDHPLFHAVYDVDPKGQAQHELTYGWRQRLP